MKKFEMPNIKVNTFSIENIVTGSSPTDQAMEQWQNENEGARTTTLSFNDLKLVY